MHKGTISEIFLVHQTFSLSNVSPIRYYQESIDKLLPLHILNVFGSLVTGHNIFNNQQGPLQKTATFVAPYNQWSWGDPSDFIMSVNRFNSSTLSSVQINITTNQIFLSRIKQKIFRFLNANCQWQTPNIQ